MWFYYRYQPIIEKKDELPVFNINCKTYRKHKAIEIKHEHCKMMFNTGFGPSLINSGNLGVESTNAFINQYVIIYILFIYDSVLI